MEDQAIIPLNHDGASYHQLLADISVKRRTKRYLEIGVQSGILLKCITTDLGICVDPTFNITENIMENKKRLSLFHMTSDEFFSDNDAMASITGPIDLAFLDGMHTFEYLLRDFYNTEALCSSTSLIALHDCLPLNAEMTQRDLGHSVQIGQGTRHPNYWTGDVWKIIPILQKYRPDLEIVCVETPPTGIVFITNLDPHNKVLQKSYMEIVKEFFKVPNMLSEIEKMYQSIKLRPAREIMNDFDHSLYLRA